MLCNACDRIWVSVRTKSPGSWTGERPVLFEYPVLENAWAGAHHTESNALLSAFNQHCYICSTIFRDFSPELREQACSFRTFYQMHLTNGYEVSQHGSDQYKLQFTVEILQGQAPIAKERTYECTGVFKIVPVEDVQGLSSQLKLSDNTKSKQCEKQVYDWLEQCKREHGSCNQKWPPKQNYPRRLLKIIPDDRFQLVDFEMNRDRPRYVTLSHCWEIASQLTLTDTTEAQLLGGLSMDRLPKKFKNAMAIAQWMKIDYIWIDALCILQDSEPDWLIQSTCMGDIYSNSYCNIAAATSSKQDKGLFTSRWTDMVEPYAVRNPRSSDSTETHVIGYDDFLRNSLLGTTLHNRGWVLQERLLSPRNIHCGQEQIFWECRAKMACEAYPDGIPHQFCNHKTRAWRQSDQILDGLANATPAVTVPRRRYLSVLANYLPKLFRMTDPKTTPTQLAQAHKIWSKTVERYMECKLTVPNDKLVAISGIAQKIAEVTGEQYLAGLWNTPMLALSLLWYVLSRSQADGTPSVRSGSAGAEDYRAPSWSWASVEARIVWNFPTSCSTILIEIVATKVDELQQGRMGRISSAAMSIRGFLFKASLHIVSENTDGALEESGRYGLKLKTSEQEGSGPCVSGTSQFGMEPVVYLDTPLLPGATSADVYLLPVCLGWAGRSAHLATELAGLLLRKLSISAGVDKYERVGIFGLDQTQATMLGNIVGGASDSLERTFAAMPRSSIDIV